MKLEFNKKYTSIAIYCFLVVAAAILFYHFISDFGTVKSWAVRLVGLLMPFIYGAAFAYILNPILNWLERTAFPVLFKNKVGRKGRRIIGVILSVLFGLSMVALFLAILIPQIVDSINTLAGGLLSFLPKAERFVNQLAADYGNSQMFIDLLQWLNSSSEMLEESARKILQGGFGQVTNLLPNILGGVMKVTNSLLDVVVGIIISIYLLLAKETFYAQVKKLAFAIFPEKQVCFAISLAHDSNAIFTGFISGKILDSAIIGVLCFIGMSFFKLPFALLVSVIVGVTNVIPYFGPFIGAFVSFPIIFIASPIDSLYFLIFVLVLQQLDGNVIGPKILGDSTGLSSFWVIFAVTFFGGLWGFLGMLVGVPLFAVIYSLIRRWACYRLQRKGMPTDTHSFASPENQLIIKKPAARPPEEKGEKE